MSQAMISLEVIERRIFLIRGKKVMLDFHLAELYGVPTKRLNEQVHRNVNRFPEDFMFELTQEESESLRSQIATSKINRGGRRYFPYAFTEQGVAMLSSVLRSERAVEVNIQIMRTFVILRRFLSTHKELGEKLKDLEEKYDTHDRQIRAIFDAIKQLMQPPARPKRQIGFRIEESKTKYRVRKRGKR